MGKSRFIVVLIVALLLAGCQSATATLAPSPTAISSGGSSRSIPTSSEQVPRITPQELKSLLDAGRDVVIVDTRSLDAYETAHIPDATQMSASEVSTRYRELPIGAKVVTYCA